MSFTDLRIHYAQMLRWFGSEECQALPSTDLDSASFWSQKPSPITSVHSLRCHELDVHTNNDSQELDLDNQCDNDMHIDSGIDLKMESDDDMNDFIVYDE